MVDKKKWFNEDVEVLVGDFCVEKNSDQVYTVTSLTDSDDSVQITPRFPGRKGTAKIAKISKLEYLPAIPPKEVKLVDYNDEVSAAVGKYLMDRTVFLAYGRNPIGTGTLVKCQGVYGILTASHVLHAVDPAVVFGEHDKKFLTCLLTTDVQLNLKYRASH